MKIRTNAKVNLFLHIMGTRPDGYHELETVLHGVRLADDIEITPLDEPVVRVEMTLDGDVRGEVPEEEENIAYLAARALASSGEFERGARIEILKRIPIAAGLGGGSGNAAGVLVILNEIWGLDIAEKRLLELAGTVGSDVPYCIGGGTALAKSRGDQLTRLPGPEDMWFVLGVSERPLRTADVYATWDRRRTTSDVGSAPMTLALGAGNPIEIASLLHNDLEPAAFELRPELAAKKEALGRAGALGTSLSGSGPTLFGVAAGEDHASAIAARVRDDFNRVLVVRSQPDCIERLD